MKFHEKLYNLRKDKRMSQEELAEKLEISRQAVSKWETGDSLPETAKLLAIAKYFNVSIDYLLNDNATEYRFQEVSDINASHIEFDKKEHLLKKYCLISAILITLFGAYRIICSMVNAVTLWQGIIYSGNKTILIIPIIQIIIGAVLTASGTVLITKLRQK